MSASDAVASSVSGDGRDVQDGAEESSGRKMAKEHEKSTADLDRVTDHVEERDIDSQALTDSMHAMLGSTAAKKKGPVASRDRELAKVKIQQSDIDRIVDELELDPKSAERALREAQGNLVDALSELVK